MFPEFLESRRLLNEPPPGQEPDRVGGGRDRVLDCGGLRGMGLTPLSIRAASSAAKAACAPAPHPPQSKTWRQFEWLVERVSGCHDALQLALAAMILFFAAGAAAETTNTLSDAEIQGRQFVQNILDHLDQRPTENFTNAGILQIHPAKNSQTEIPLTCKVIVTTTNWVSLYQVSWTSRVEAFSVVRAANQPDEYFYYTNAADRVPLLGDIPILGHLFRSHKISAGELTSSFAGSDFWLCDLGLEFFHWPQQKVLKKEFHRQCACTVLESTNPNPSTNGYSRVVSWIDEDSLGTVEAYAYDLNGKKLKNFYPKNFEKVNGQYQVQSLIMDNLQTGSRSRLEFDLKK